MSALGSGVPPLSGSSTAPVINPAGGSGAQEMTPVATLGYGARESADTQRQRVDEQMAHDEPEDINFNAVVSRSQVQTFDTLGKNYESNQDARQKMADANLDFRQKLQDRFLKA